MELGEEEERDFCIRCTLITSLERLKQSDAAQKWASWPVGEKRDWEPRNLSEPGQHVRQVWKGPPKWRGITG